MVEKTSEQKNDIPECIEVTGSLELKSDIPVYFKAKRDSLTHFHF